MSYRDGGDIYDDDEVYYEDVDDESILNPDGSYQGSGGNSSIKSSVRPFDPTSTSSELASRDRFGSSGIRSTGNSDSSKSGSSFSSGSTFGRSSSTSSPSSPKPPDTSKKSDKKSSGGSLFGNIGSRIIPGKKDDKKSTKSSSSSSSPFKFGNSDKDSKKSTKSSGSRFGNLGSKLGLGGKKSSDKSSSGRTFEAKSSSSTASSYGNSRTTGSSSNKDNAKSAAKTAGVFAAVTGIFRRGNKDDASTASTTTSKKSASKTPQVKQDGLSLDTKLDILGVALVFISLVLFFSSISTTQAAIGGIHIALGQALGWGAIAVPIALFAIGMWLIVRHFGERAPAIDPVRIAGIVLFFVALLVLFQFVHSFGYSGVADANGAVNLDMLKTQIDLSAQEGQAGGIFGGYVYYNLVATITEFGAFFIMLFAFLLAFMLITRLSASELAAFSISSSRSIRSRIQQRAIRRRAERLQNQPALAAADNITISSPRQEQLPEGSTNALPEGTTMPITQRDILIRQGGHELEPAEINQSQSSDENGGSGFFRSPFKATAGVATAIAGGLTVARLNPFSRKNEETENTPEPVPLAENIFESQSTQQPQIQHTNYTDANIFSDPVTPSYETVANGESAGDVANDVPKTREQALAERQARMNAIRQGQASAPVAQQATAPVADPVTNADSSMPANGNGHENIPTTSNPFPAPPTETKTGNSNIVQSAAAASIAKDVVSQPVKQPISQGPTNQTKPKTNWRLPEYRTLLASGTEQQFNRKKLLDQAKIIENTLAEFGAPGTVVEINTGPVITQFGVEPIYLESKSGKKSRVKVSSIAALDKDLQLALGARSIRVEAPVPGKGFVGIEVPNDKGVIVNLRDVMETEEFKKVKSPLAIALGQSVDGAPVVADLTSMPHLLIAGTTGSGKSVCVNSIIGSILTLNPPNRVKMIMVDPKRVELTGYNGIPHLVAPVVVELEKTLSVLKWVTREMDERYKKFSNHGARNITDFNMKRPATEEEMPYIVVFVDELADLMMMAPEETERVITRVAALARATGIHLVIATQRPSADVVTGLIKANFPARIAFAVASGIDSRVIIDQPGAEKLLGKGDMLYMSGNSPAPLRVQGVFVSDTEINNVVRYWKMQAVEKNVSKNDTPVFEAQTMPSSPPSNIQQGTEKSEQQAIWDEFEGTGHSGFDDQESLDPNEDVLYDKAVDMVRRLDKASVSLLQRRLRIGYTRAARLIDIMEERGVVGPAKEGSSKPRDVMPF